jgi:hypothetical protein
MANAYSAGTETGFAEYAPLKITVASNRLRTGAALAAAGNRRTRMFQGTIDTGTAMPIEATVNGDVLFDLGMIYSTGRSGLIDLVAAHKWFNLAALKGRVDAIALRREVAGLMSDAEIAAAQREARAWMATH